MLTLWDLIEPVAKRLDLRPPPPRATARPAASPRRKKSRPNPDSMQAKYDAVVQEMLRTHGIRVRKWRTSMTGVAWTVTYTDGTVSRLIESPRPRGPMSAAIFLHEVGHHAIGIGRYRPRCLEEYHAWAWSLQQMEAHGLNITDAVRYRVHASLHYAIAKALRRGIKDLPPELAPYTTRPPRLRKKTGARA